jgi:hypothetical protein
MRNGYLTLLSYESPKMRRRRRNRQVLGYTVIGLGLFAGAVLLLGEVAPLLAG